MTGRTVSGKTVATLLLTTAGVAMITAAASIALERYRAKKEEEAKHRPKPNGMLKVEKVDPELEKLFQVACDDAKNLTEISHTEKLILYSLYKQSTEGDAPQKSTSFMLNFVEKAKFNAWSRLRGMSRTEAILHYREAVQQLLQHGTMDAEGDDYLDALDLGGSLGNKPSTMIQPDDYYDGMDLTPEQIFLRAAGQNDVATLKKMLQESPNLISHHDEDGQCCLHLSADKGSVDALKFLLQAGADVNASDGDGISVLQAAVIADNLDVCKVLLEHGANPDAADSDGDTPRSSANEDGSKEMKSFFEKY